MNIINEYATITLTFSECVENHIGNQQIGTIANSGFPMYFLRSIAESDSRVQLHNMSYDGYEAGVLVIPNGVDILTYHGAADDLLREQSMLTTDKKYWDRRRKKVLNKNARHNLCFADFSQDPIYEEGKGTVVDFDTQPVLSSLRQGISSLVGEELYAEGNYYHANRQSGIGFHGDTERRKIVGMRLGQTMPLVYRWYCNSVFMGIEYNFTLNHGDMYIMSSKAGGSDWRKRKIPTLRHAAGSPKYTSPSTKDKTLNPGDGDIRQKIKNPETDRMITVGGKVHLNLVRRGLL